MADIHFEKFDPEVKGIGQVINWETAKALAGTYKYVNREQDLGIEGLRQAKRSYSPEYVLNAFSWTEALNPSPWPINFPAYAQLAAMTPFSISRSTCLVTMSAKRRNGGWSGGRRCGWRPRRGVLHVADAQAEAESPRD